MGSPRGGRPRGAECTEADEPALALLAGAIHAALENGWMPSVRVEAEAACDEATRRLGETLSDDDRGRLIERVRIRFGKERATRLEDARRRANARYYRP